MPTQLINSTEQLADLSGGWIPSTFTWTYLSSDSPSFVVYNTQNVTGTFGVGMKMQLTHQSTTKNFIITAVSLTGTTTYLNLYGGTDYTLNVTGAITNPLYSWEKSPFGFNTNPDKWTVSSVTTTTPVKSSPSASTWYGGSGLSPTGPSLDIPIGTWRVFYRAMCRLDTTLGAVGSPSLRSTLSTANNSESDNELTSGGAFTLPAAADVVLLEFSSEKNINLTSKTTYYLNIFTGASSVTSIQINSAGAFSNVIKAVCAYL